MEYKKGLIATLLHRTYVICSDYSKLHEEINKLKVIWQKNSFPLFFIDRCVKNFLEVSNFGASLRNPDCFFVLIPDFVLKKS